MQPLVIVIILLSFLGLYINLGTNSHMKDPELVNPSLEIPHEKLELQVADDSSNAIIPAPVLYDEIGNSIVSTGDNLTNANQLINLKIDNGNYPNTHLIKKSNSSSIIRNQYGIAMSTGDDAGYVYSEGETTKINPSNRLSSKIDLRKSKTFGRRGYVKEANIYTKYAERAIDILKNGTANKNKNFLNDTGGMVEFRLKPHNTPQIPDQLEFNVKPEYNKTQDSINKSVSSKNSNNLNHLINSTKNQLKQ